MKMKFSANWITAPIGLAMLVFICWKVYSPKPPKATPQTVSILNTIPEIKTDYETRLQSSGKLTLMRDSFVEAFDAGDYAYANRFLAAALKQDYDGHVRVRNYVRGEVSILAQNPTSTGYSRFQTNLENLVVEIEAAIKDPSKTYSTKGEAYLRDKATLMGIVEDLDTAKSLLESKPEKEFVEKIKKKIEPLRDAAKPYEP